MLRLFKKTLAVCLIGFGLRSITCNITSILGLAIYSWSYHSCGGNSMAFMLAEKLKTKECASKNDYSSKKSS